MKARIYTNTILGHRSEETEMTTKQLSDLRKEIVNNLRTWFRWADYQAINTHLLYYAELDGVAYLYKQGWIMSDREFDELIAMREGIGFVGAMHRGTGMFGK